jgi:hypothetical protein
MAALGIGLSEAVVRYADRFHAALGTGHHVASPFGAWLLLALAARAASGDTRAELAQVLGDDVDDAAAWADALLSKPHPLVSAVRQAVVARYTRVGFEAAAVTGFAMTSSRRHSHAGLRREARLRFAHPYAVVAVAANETDETRDPWHGLPVFSAWVAEPDDAGQLPD